MVCNICKTNEAVSDGLCKRCSLISRWGKNTSKDDLGIYYFFKSVIPKAFKNFQYGFPDIHKEILWECLRDDPKWNLYDRMIAIGAPRGISKTTLLTKGFVLYATLMKTHKYIVIASKTGRTAQKSLRWIKQALGSSKVVAIFGDIRPVARTKKTEIDVIPGKWTSDIVVLENGVTIEAVGMGQQLRSAVEGEESNRIELFIADDTETDENTRTPERRENNEVWLFENVLPAIDIDKGKIIFINTLTDNQSILAKISKPNSGWRSKMYGITKMDNNGNEISVWPEKFPVKIIEQIRDRYTRMGRLNSFYKEFYNIVYTNSGFSERKIKYYTGDIIRTGDTNWIRYRDVSLGSEATTVTRCSLGLGVDMAFSAEDDGDYTALVPVALTYDGKYFVFPYTRGSLTMLYDDFKGEKLVSKGIIDEIKRMMEKYKFDVITIDATGTQKGIFSQIKNDISNIYPYKYGIRILPYIAPGGRSAKPKHTRLKDYLQPKYECGIMYHQNNMDSLKNELLSFGSTTDDILDALFNSMINLRRPESPGIFDSAFGNLEYVERPTYHNNYIDILRNVM